ncbi:putative haloacid dehalogenase [Desulfuromonas soudanensis]|uniref:phosphoglycolate phosphatase n=1 Tax=Desulfuromonas soudanensis TaxID=1603606 RepID=A0A0M4D4I7_9BACT|nr:HAD-IA family hydrolase [Desulfuromonas soudanensis]ALC15510.1 putative haloacid dehalogenase [Desulfuromonas soudanensis]
MPIDTFLFDLDGTLVDSVADLATAVNLLRGELDLPPLPREAVRSYVGDGATLLVQRALPPGLYSERRLQRFLRLYGDHLLEETAIYPGIRDFLETLHNRRLAVVTNKPLALTLRLLDGLHLRRFFPVVLGGDSCLTKKPDPAPVVEALRQLQRPPESAVMIGDHHTDLRAGRAAGVRTCFCAWGIGESGGVASDFFAATPFDLPRLFPGAAP